MSPITTHIKRPPPKHDCVMHWASRPHRGYSAVLEAGKVRIEVVWFGRSRRSRQCIAQLHLLLSDLFEAGWRDLVARALMELRRALRDLRRAS